MKWLDQRLKELKKLSGCSMCSFIGGRMLIGLGAGILIASYCDCCCLKTAGFIVLAIGILLAAPSTCKVLTK